MLPSPSQDVIFKSVSDGAVLFHTGQEVYFGLNAVGAKIWELLPPRCRTWEELLRELRTAYPEVDEATLRHDVEELLEELEDNGLLTPAGPRNDAAAAEAHGP
ncbi:MAG TPA: PqqD family protein [Longimicrobiaceae bacterium]|nr:PqqD family protein [Longimicrobiaceae bacterium]